MYQFSIVIPCFNSSPYIAETLESIVNQHLGDKIQVVLVDDCSIEPFDEIVNAFNDRLNIKMIKTDSNCGPGMARQAGVDNADGEWITFCDHDDTFIANTFNRIRTIIRNNPSRNIIQTQFQEVRQDGTVIPYSFDKGSNWIHAKFFRKKFLDENKLTFKEGLATHEDVYFSILTRFMTEHLNAPILECSIVIYNWYNRPESLSHRRETGIDLFENHFEDYVTSCFGPIEKLKDILTPNEILVRGLSSLLFIYFYSQGFLRLGREHHERDVKLLNEVAGKLCEYLNLTPQQIVQIAYDNPDVFCGIREKAYQSVGYFLEREDLYDLIRNCISQEEEMVDLSESNS